MLYLICVSMSKYIFTVVSSTNRSKVIVDTIIDYSLLQAHSINQVQMLQLHLMYCKQVPEETQHGLKQDFVGDMHVHIITQMCADYVSTTILIFKIFAIKMSSLSGKLLLRYIDENIGSPVRTYSRSTCTWFHCF